MLAQIVAPFACLFFNWSSSFCKFSIIGLISGLRFSLLYKFSCLSYFSLKIVMFSWVVKCLEDILAFSLKQDLVYSHQSLAEERLLNLWPRVEGSYKIKSVCPSFHLLVSFLGISSLVFSETLKLNFMLKAIYSYVWQSWIFLKKFPSGKNGQKWPKHMVFGHFKKIKSLALSAFCVNWKFLWFINIWKNCILVKNLVLKLKTKVALHQWDFSVL